MPGWILMQWLKSRYRLLLEAINSSLAIDRDVVEQAVAANIVRILWTAPIISFAQILAALAFGLREPSLMPAEITWHKCVL